MNRSLTSSLPLAVPPALERTKSCESQRVQLSLRARTP
jgi:hypothetical protein